MPIDPRAGSSLGELSGLVQAINDATRRINALEGGRGGVMVGANSIVASQIGYGQVIGAQHIQAGSINTGNMTAGSINADRLVANSVTATQIDAASVRAAILTAGSITAGMITVGSLSAISTNMGSITAGTITGGTLQTAASGSRVVMDSAGLRGYALDGVTKVFEINAGSGIASFTGIATISAGSVVPGSTLTGTIPASTVPAIGGGNRLSDSSMESTATLSGLYNDRGSITTIVRTTAVARSGLNALSSTKITAAGAIQQITTPSFVTVPGDVWTFTAYVRSAAVARSATASFRYSGASGATYHSDATAGTAVTTTTTGWQRVRVTATVPAGLVSGNLVDRVQPLIAFASAGVGETHYSDDWQLELGEVPTAYAPRPDEILPGTVVNAMVGANAISNGNIQTNAISAGNIQTDAVTGPKILAASITAAKIAANTITANEIASGAITTNKLNVTMGGGNLAPNSSFESTTTALGGTSGTGYSYGSSVPSSAAAIVASGRLGGNCISITTPASGSGTFSVYTRDITATPNAKPQVTAGLTYTSSIWVKPTVTGSYTLYLTFHPDNTTNHAYTTGSYTVTKSCPANVWTRIVITATAPALSTYAGMYLYQAAATLSCTTLVDDFQLEEGDVATAYAPATSEILPGTIIASQIAADTITANQIATDAITANELQAGAVTTAKMTANTINGNVITGNTLDAGKIIANTITATQIATGAITANVIQAGAITTQKLAFTQPSPNLLLDSGFEFTTDPVSGADIRGWQASTNANAVTNGSSSPLYGSKYGILTVTGIAANAQIVATNANRPVVSYSAAGNSYTFSVRVRQGAALANRAARLLVTWLDSAGAAVSTTTGSAFNLTADTTTWASPTLTNVVPSGAVRALCYIRVEATSGSLAAAETYHLDGAMFEAGSAASPVWTPREGEVQPGSVGNTQIGADAITTDKIKALTIQAGNIATGTIKALQIDTTDLFAATITASGTITGGTLRTAASGARVQMSGSGNALDVYDSTPTNVARLDGAAGLTLLAGTGWTAENARTVTWASSSVTGTVISRVKSWRDTSINYISVGTLPGSGEVAATNFGVLDSATGYVTQGINAYGKVATNGVVQVMVDNGSRLTISASDVQISSPQLSMGGNVVIDASGGWHRAYGSGKGFVCAFGGGGIYMTDTTYIRTYGSKQFYCDSVIWAASELLTSNGLRDPTQANLYLRGGTTTNVVCQTAGAVNCDIWYATAHSSSDRRLKKNIRELPAALGTIKRLRGVTHEWKSGKGPTGRKFGFIAQEVQQVAPELVQEGDDGFLSVDYEHAIPILVEAIKELSARVESLER